MSRKRWQATALHRTLRRREEQDGVSSAISAAPREPRWATHASHYTNAVHHGRPRELFYGVRRLACAFNAGACHRIYHGCKSQTRQRVSSLRFMLHRIRSAKLAPRKRWQAPALQEQCGEPSVLCVLRGSARGTEYDRADTHLRPYGLGVVWGEASAAAVVSRPGSFDGCLAPCIYGQV